MKTKIKEDQMADITISLPDGSKRTYAAGVTGTEIAASIGAGLAKAALAVTVDGQLSDLSLAIHEDAELRIITLKDEEALELIRHDAAHIMAEAVQELFPGTQVTIGPAIENGFYYDFARKEHFTPEDLEKIEKKMAEIVDRNEPFVREVWDRNEAIKHFEKIGENYKAELIRDLPESETITIYRQGKWHDLCRGPHLPSTGRIGKAFKLMSIAGAYWRGNSDNEMLQRIYGTAWRDKKELDAYLHFLEEAEKRDHRRLGKDLNLFHLQEEAAGSVFWHPKGFAIYHALENYMRKRLYEYEYTEVKTPQMIDSSLWKKSGHWDKFRENMYLIKQDENDNKEFALKPMNCPAHIQIFKQGMKSYRDLPIRFSEYGCCHRNESSGSLHGIMRVRQMTQDDGHVFCREDQIISETKHFTEMLLKIYKDFGFDDVIIKFSDRPETRAGSDDIWDRAEAGLKQAIEELGLEYKLNPGEGAFYGPKLEFVLKDTLGRDWQCGTLQLDFVLPERLDANYIAEDGSKQKPVMLHRAVFGSFERFIGVLIEHYAGKFPLWLAPMQTVVATITNDVDDYANEVTEALKSAGLRVDLDNRNEKINYKIREHSVQKVPCIIVLGYKERDERKVTIRRLGSQNQESLTFDEAVAMLSKEAESPLGDLLPMKVS
jgi:threonyl-tRNA synthetase